MFRKFFKRAAPAHAPQAHLHHVRRIPGPTEDKQSLHLLAPETKTLPQGEKIKMQGGVRFLAEELETTQSLASRVIFDRIINETVKLAQHLHSSVAVAQISHAKTCVIFADRTRVSDDDISAVVDLLETQGYSLPTKQEEFQGYFAPSHLILSLSQGHLNASALNLEREIARTPAMNILMNTFTDIVCWAYLNNADDLDFAVNLHASKSQICFKIGGKYVRPEMFLIPTQTVIQMLGLVWQKSGGGGDPQFHLNAEQQANVAIDLPRKDNMPDGARLRLRWSGMPNDKGTVVTMRLQRLGKSAVVRSLDDAGYFPEDIAILKRVMNSEGGITTFSGVVGSGKSTSLAQILSLIPDDKKKISIEDPVELEILNMYQKTISRDLTATGPDPGFISAVRAVYRSAMDILLLGEIRDETTGLLARSIAESGHSVYTTTHAKSALGVIDRFTSPAIGIPRDVLATPDIVKLLAFQALLPTTCKFCGKTPSNFAHAHELKGDKLSTHQAYFSRIERLYGIDAEKFILRDPAGCEHCKKQDLPELNGYSGRTVVYEMVELDEIMLGHILKADNLKLYKHWRSLSHNNGKVNYEDENLIGKDAMECAILKASKGLIDPREIEPRFMDFKSVEIKRNSTKSI